MAASELTVQPQVAPAQSDPGAREATKAAAAVRLMEGLMGCVLCARRRKRITIELKQLDRARLQAKPCATSKRRSIQAGVGGARARCARLSATPRCRGGSGRACAVICSAGSNTMRWVIGPAAGALPNGQSAK